ncbi:MAG: dihydroorotase [Lachnospiraceae bacterium]|nr:dihydroorotase [Lachnospiraceae bacterium]
MLIKNGIIIDPGEDRMFKADLLIREGKILSVHEWESLSAPEGENHPLSEGKTLSASEGKTLSAPEGKALSAPEGKTLSAPEGEIIDASGLYIAPGLADTHVHFRDPGFTHKEDILTGAMAAAAGGFTEVIMMANTSPRIDNPAVLKEVLDKGKTTGIRVHACANVTLGMKGEKLTDLEGLKAAGALGFTDDGIPLMNEGIVKEAMRKAALLNVPLSFHEEDPSLIGNNGINRGKASAYFKVEGSPGEAEISLIKRDIGIAKEVQEEMSGKSDGPVFVIQHISTKEGVELVREAKRSGLSIHAEATPHHFSLTEEAIIRHGSYAKMNPPLRTEEDRIAILEGLRDGTIDLIATDHAPHTKEEKDVPVTEAPSGITGLETSLSLAIRELIIPGILDYPELLCRMSLSPRKLYGLPGGRIEEGGAADLVLFDPEAEWEVTPEHLHSKSKNTPFLGEKLPGVVRMTICGGNIVYRA